MPTTEMFRVTQVVTGVAGAPYYLTGYFDAISGQEQFAAGDWATFCRFPADQMREGLVYEPITTVDRVDPVSGDVVGRVNVSVPGVAAATGQDPLPPSNQLVVNWRTGAFTAGREVRGRTNLPGWLEAASTNGRPTNTLLDAVQSKAVNLVANATNPLVVYSKKNGAWQAVQTTGVMAEWAVLRSRRD